MSPLYFPLKKERQTALENGVISELEGAIDPFFDTRSIYGAG